MRAHVKGRIKQVIAAAAVGGTAVLAPVAGAREYFVGGPVHKNDMEIVANYLVGVEMAPTTPNMPHGSDVIHLEADVAESRRATSAARTSAATDARSIIKNNPVRSPIVSGFPTDGGFAGYLRLGTVDQ
jgi:hypothetical protein